MTKVSYVDRIKKARLAAQVRLKDSGVMKVEVRDEVQAQTRMPVAPLVELESVVPEVPAIRQAMEKVRGRDRLGLAGEHLATAGGVAAGVAVAGSIAGAAGATTLLGSTSLAGVLGGVLVTTTPVGWVIGSAAVMGAAGYGIAKLIRSGSEQDRLRKAFIERQAHRLMGLETAPAAQDEKIELSQLIALTLAAGVLEQDVARRMVNLVNAGKLPASLALERVRAIALAEGVVELKGESLG